MFLFERHMGTSGAYNDGRGYGPIVSHWLQDIQEQIINWEGESASDYPIRVLDLTEFTPLKRIGQ